MDSHAIIRTLVTASCTALKRLTPKLARKKSGKKKSSRKAKRNRLKGTSQIQRFSHKTASFLTLKTASSLTE
jgi:hypothetical protein